VPDARTRAEAGELAFGTVDSFLIWHLTGGRVHATDVTNASRTMLYKLGLGHDGGWSEQMLRQLGSIPASLLPEVKRSGGRFGETDPALFGRAIPILSAIGDQQAALVGQGCLAPGMAKITYGTGAFLVANTGSEKPKSTHRLLGTIGYEASGERAFALEGSIFNAGTAVQWLRDEMGFFTDASESEAMAAGLADNGGVYFVPAFTGLGAPHWNAEARGQITGITRDTKKAHIVRAGLEAAAYQTADLLAAFAADGVNVRQLRVDGGMTSNDWLMQFLADITNRAVERPKYQEMTALGACILAAAELDWLSLKDWSKQGGEVQRFEPMMDEDTREQLLASWQAAVRKVLE
ncbi:MAG: FGGY-family carbohydrate kinase, partial [Hyphomonadaceae bacterium]